MYKASFQFPVIGAGTQGGQMFVAMGTTFIKSILEMLPVLSKGGSGVDLDERAVTADGVPCNARLVWSREASGFSVNVDGINVGIVHLDELEAALDIPRDFAMQAKACSVSFDMSGFAVWRAALIDIDTGKIRVLTKQADFNYLPVTVWLGCNQGLSESLVSGELTPGEVRHGYMLTEAQRRWMVDGLEGKKLDDDNSSDITALSSLYEDVRSFISSSTGQMR